MSSRVTRSKNGGAEVPRFMKILIAYDGSGYSRNTLDDLRRAGLPNKAKAVIISVSEVWLRAKIGEVNSDTSQDNEILDYIRKHSEQIDRNLSETNAVLIEARTELQDHFPGWTIEVESAIGSPAQMILERSAALRPDMIVIGPRGLSSASISGLGSIAQNVISYTPFSVRIGRGDPASETDQPKIIICFDGSPCSVEAVNTAALRNWHGHPEIRLLVVTDPLDALIPGRAFRVVPGVPENRTRGEEKWVRALAERALCTLRDAGLTASMQTYSGNPRIILVNASHEWRADTIFVGMNSRRSHWLGCVASAVASRASCSVEVISRKVTDESRNKWKQ